MPIKRVWQAWCPEVCGYCEEFDSKAAAARSLKRHLANICPSRPLGKQEVP